MNEYDLARKLLPKVQHVPELATVVGVDPLAIRMETATYRADKWHIYEAHVTAQDVVLEEAEVKGKDSDGFSIRVEPTIKAGALVMRNHYESGDLLLVQQLGANTFVILSKVRRV